MLSEPKVRSPLDAMYRKRAGMMFILKGSIGALSAGLGQARSNIASESSLLPEEAEAIAQAIHILSSVDFAKVSRYAQLREQFLINHPSQQNESQSQQAASNSGAQATADSGPLEEQVNNPG